jgi:hypothetical protein
MYSGMFANNGEGTMKELHGLTVTAAAASMIERAIVIFLIN